MEFIEVDGSQGEGGGQILRSAVAFSAILRRPVKVVNVRAGREVPGLKRQHVSVLEILARVFGGQLSGASEGSSTITFVPGRPQSGTFSFEMGTAASITLVLQAVVPAAALSGADLSLTLGGGTDVPWSPTLDYFQRVVRDAYAWVGIHFDLAVGRRGYYPRGGGRVTASISPCRAVLPLNLDRRAPVTGAKLVSRCGSLPRHVAERQLESASRVLVSTDFEVLGTEISREDTDSPGSSILVFNVGKAVFLGSDAIGARGKPAEEVGSEASSRFVDSAKSGATLDHNLADMLLPLLSLAAGPSRVRVPEVTPHLKTGMELAKQFTSCSWSVSESENSVVVEVVPLQSK